MSARWWGRVPPRIGKIPTKMAAKGLGFGSVQSPEWVDNASLWVEIAGGKGVLAR